MARLPSGAYADPLDLIWLRFAADLGWTIVRSDETYASWDGKGTLTLCTPAAFDADDSLAQLILHEACHALVQGHWCWSMVDWGLDNTDDAASATAEHATHRLQAALLDRFGLRALLGVTTDWRPYWDALPDDPLLPGDDPAIPLARTAFHKARTGPMALALDRALRATADLAEVVRPSAGPESLWARTEPRNELGLRLDREGRRCGACAWFDGDQCVRESKPNLAAHQACASFEPKLDCRACGACCREAFHCVEVGEDEEAAYLGMLDRFGSLVIPRPGGLCPALSKDEGGWTCAVYAIRPRACDDFEQGGASCLLARQRVGLTV